MDSAAEERLVRMALDGTQGVRRIDADLNERQAIIIHEGPAQAIEARLRPLNFGAAIRTTAEVAPSEYELAPAASDEGHALRIVLAINAVMFAGEMFGAFLADSSALLADSLDMFADATVYAIALFRVHRVRTTQLALES